MKQLKVVLSLVMAVFCFTAVNAQSTKSKVTKAATKTVYQCPMKCEGEKTYKKAGKCPVCSMKLKATKPAATLAYQCPMKCEGEKTYDKAGKCPVCGMNLKKKETVKPNKDHDGHGHN